MALIWEQNWRGGDLEKIRDKLHICCGEVYLEGYHNVDAPVEGYSFIAAQRPDIVKVNLTTFDNYYKFPLGQHPLKLCVADELVNILEFKYPKNYFKEILMVSAFEHLSLDDARIILKKFFNSLAKNGILLFDVPDIEASFVSMKNDRRIDNLFWHMRLIYGSQKNPYSFHKWGYTKEMLKKELKNAGFNKVEFMQILPHDYPMIGVRAVKR